MSGDVQPRKRKDKRRKKEGGSLGSIHEPITSHKFKRSESDDKKVFDLPEQGEKIHVQNEHGVGGNICVKIVFFCLFGLLIGAVGLIYMKSLGSTDVDLPTIEESRFAEYFTGWLDESSDDHEHEVLENNLDHDDHDEHDDDDHEDEHDEQDDHDDHDEDDEHEEDQEDPIYKLFGLGTNEVDEAEDDVKEDVVAGNEQSGIRPEVDEDEDDNEEDDKEDDEEEEEENNDSEDKEEVNEDEEEDEDEKEEDDSGVAMDEEDKDDEDDEDLSQMDEDDEDKYNASQADEDEKIESKKEVHKSNENEDEEDEREDDKDKDLSEEQIDDNKDEDNDDEDEQDEQDDKGSKEDEDEEDVSREEDSYKTDDDLGFEEINVSEEDLEEDSDQKENIEEPEFKKESRNQLLMDNEEEIKATEDESDNEEEETESGGVAVKLGVGIALIIVAHLVLVKKWKSMNNAPTDEILSSEVKESKGVENLPSLDEPVISRRQTLVPENVYLNDEADEEELEDEEEEGEEEEDGEEEYSEEECEEEEFQKSKSDNLETFEKLSWNIKKSENEKDYGNKVVKNKDIAEEEEEEEEEEIEDEEEEEYEEDEEAEEEEEEELEDEEEEEDEDENDYVKQKVHTTHADEREEEIDNPTPIPPPRSKTGRGAQDIDEDSMHQYEDFTKVEETSQDVSKAGDETNNSGPEERKTSEKKVGNEDEWAFRQELDFADEQFENNPKAAVEAYDKIIAKKPTVIRALIGRARALDHWAEKEKSNTYLKQAINAYKTLLLNHGHHLDEETYVKMAERCIERMRFGGAFISAIDIHKALISKYPNTPKYRNTLAVTYLMLNKIPQARVILNETLTLWPDDGFALVHYGFILKTSDNDMEEGAKKLMAGIQTRQQGVIDGMFFFHLGDALNRLGRGKEAMHWYELGVKEGLFLNKYQRSLYNVNRLKGQPWWTKEETTYQDFFKKLEENWREIRKEGLELLNAKGINLFKEEAENLKDTGDWKQLDLYFRGRKQPNCYKAPLTCSLVSSFKPASTCTRGQIKFSVMLPNTHVWPHCGPTNCRLRSHLGLVVPKNTFIRVAEETRSWEEGKFIVFDDSFEHEVWHNGTGLRLVLIVDVWHPELTNHERRTLSPI